MSKNIIQMAIHAGLVYKSNDRLWMDAGEPGHELEQFAAFVAAAEREEIIDLVAMYGGPVDLEAAIRARGKA
jgi:hypothetical protein